MRLEIRVGGIDTDILTKFVPTAIDRIIEPSPPVGSPRNFALRKIWLVKHLEYVR